MKRTTRIEWCRPLCVLLLHPSPHTFDGEERPRRPRGWDRRPSPWARDASRGEANDCSASLVDAVGCRHVWLLHRSVHETTLRIPNHSHVRPNSSTVHAPSPAEISIPSSNIGPHVSESRRGPPRPPPRVGPSTTPSIRGESRVLRTRRLANRETGLRGYSLWEFHSAPQRSHVTTPPRRRPSKAYERTRTRANCCRSCT